MNSPFMHDAKVVSQCILYLESAYSLVTPIEAAIAFSLHKSHHGKEELTRRERESILVSSRSCALLFIKRSSALQAHD